MMVYTHIKWFSKVVNVGTTRSVTKDDKRWVQRFDSCKKALAELREAVALSEERPLSKLDELVLSYENDLSLFCHIEQGVL